MSFCRLTSISDELPVIFGHRGAAAYTPENTLISFEKAVEMGADAIELDVHLTADGFLVVIHDERVDRTTDGSGQVHLKTLREIKELDAGFRFSPDGGGSFPFRGQGIRIPTLDEVLKALPEILFNITIKPGGEDAATACARVIRENSAQSRVMVASEDVKTISIFRRAAPEVPTAAAAREVFWFWAAVKMGISRCLKPRFSALQVPEWYKGLKVITKRFIRKAHEGKLPVHAWVINDPEDMRRLVRMGVDGIITDYPDVAKRILLDGVQTGAAHDGTHRSAP